MTTTPPKSTTKRTPVPKVERPKAPPIPEETAQVDPEPINEGNTMKPESFFKKSITMISNNRETIKRKVIVGVGTGIGMLIASAITDALNRREVVYVTREPTIGEEAGWGPSDRVVHFTEPVAPRVRTPRKKPVAPVDDEVEGPNVED